jgi:hypothetical protein
MVTPLQIAVGTFALLIGAAWAIAPIKMSELQREYLYFWEQDSDIEGTNAQVIAGRISGIILVAAGGAILLGYIP